jgi:hypothetical protein
MPVVARIHHDHLMLDLRTVPASDDEQLALSVASAVTDATRG